MTARSARGPNHAADRTQDRRLAAGGAETNAVLDTPVRQDGPSRDRAVYRATTALRPHPGYQELRGPMAATRLQRAARQAGPIHEPLLTTVDGTILDGHARWQVAIDCEQSTLPCFVYDVTEDEALQIVIQRHRRFEGLNDFGRIVLALGLESYFRERHRPTATGQPRPSSKLTNHEQRDVRKDIALEAGVSTGNVTKVKQLLDTVIPEVRERLLRGEVSIHRAWRWRTLSPKRQRDALWTHVHQGGIKKTVGRLVRAHADTGAPAPPADVAITVLSGLPMYDPADITVAVVDIPGRAVVVTRMCYDELQEKHTR
jgi:hypothetical protein